MAKKKSWKPKKPYLKMVARSKRLEVRPYQHDDFVAWNFGHSGRKEKQHRYDGNKPKPEELTLKKFKERLKVHREAAAKNTGFTFGIFERKSGRVLGHIGYNVISPGYRWANLGYGVHNQYWGKGIGPEAARLCLELGFGPLDFHRIEASCEVGNKASAKVALRAGMKAEGRRKKFFSRDGGIDLLVFAQNQIDHRKKK